ncbi:hypothetical protein GSI_01309 [Ganoderma sinense ZZ0214-1]|uniref:Uncharacterized protein n=1 Tax=Ganoderma sinense ZZ0214-1 TaxID=1077348 RepID=A0A2G8SV12_9APHY|nr:hypothetical protein GSI_01309 [Ganoderma sinense ZZ0214-1]
MPEYVYAQHDFAPENPDEVSFKIGDRIEVVEKDELYGDGWWQGRNPTGQVGLFPQSYTSSTPPKPSTVAFPDGDEAEPSSSAPLQTLDEESESVTPHGDGPSPTHSQRERKASQGDVMMRETLTDVQKAIEQLGRRDGDGSRSFSFASSRGDYSERSETETDEDRDTDAEDDGRWHKDARAKLAMRAQRENEERQAREAEDQSRVMIPPIDVEVSDESDMEDDDLHASPRKPRPYSQITEEDEDQDADGEESPTKEPSGVADAHHSSDSIIVPSERYLVTDETDLRTATAATFPEPNVIPRRVDSLRTRSDTPESTVAPPNEDTAVPTPEPSNDPTPVPPSPEPLASLEPVPLVAASIPIPASPVAQDFSAAPVVQPAVAPVPSMLNVSDQPPLTTTSAVPSPTASSFASYGQSSTAGIQQALTTPATTVASLKSSTPHASGTNTPDPAKKAPADPSEWTVDDVVGWLKSKGFDQGVCDLFTEQEITGDVLLELDANILKSEIGIAAFGKRVRIINAITELRRPPVEEVEQPEQQAVGSMLTPRSLTHSFHYPPSNGSHRSHSHSHSHSQSVRSSAHQSFNNSPFSPPSPSVLNGNAQTAFATLVSPESPPANGDLPGTPPTMTKTGWRASDPGSIHGGAANLDEDVRGRSPVGLGLGLPSKSAKMRPPQLSLSPSDSALGQTVSVGQGKERRDSLKDERAALSESEGAAKDPRSMRRLFGRSTDSGSFKEKEKDAESTRSGGTPVNSPPLSTSPVDEAAPVRRRSKGNKSVDDNNKKSDRLSLFGASFTGTLGKHRKPAPRLSNVGEKVDKAEGEKHAHSIAPFSRLREKRSSSRPGTTEGGGTSSWRHPERRASKEKRDSEKGLDDEKESKRDRTVSTSPRDPALLRKRTASMSAGTAGEPRAGLVAAGLVAASVTANGAGPNLKPGQSILEQIGTPDHNGWMRKKGDRYNAWKLRYFVLKGPHLYWLRSNSKSETKIKGYLNIVGFKVLADENVDPGRYGFRIVHDTEKPHFFSSDEQLIVREWMKALMKATITRDYTNPVMSSCNIPTIPLTVAQAMNPAPRPPSPTARDATQKALRRENPNELSSRDAQVLLMGMPNKHQGERARLDSFFTNDTVSTNEPESPVARKAVAPRAPPRPSRELRRASTATQQGPSDYDTPIEPGLIEWANSHLPSNLQMKDPAGQLCGGLALLRLAEDIKGKPASPPVPDSAFPTGPYDDKLDGLFRLFDYLLDNDVKMGSVSINDIRQGRRDKVVQLLKALRAWEDKRNAIAQSIGKGSVVAGPFMGMAGPMDYHRAAINVNM